MDLAELRRESNLFLRSRGVQVNETLPLIEPADAVRPKTAQFVAKRLCAMGYIIRAGFGMPLQEVGEWIDKLGLGDTLGSEERSIIGSRTITEQQKINFGWLAEGAQVLAWALAMAELDHFRHCDDDLATKVPFMADVADFVEGAQLVPLAAIQRQADLLYAMHWATVEARLHGQTGPLNESLIRERRRAVDWVYGVEQDWDEVPLDT